MENKRHKTPYVKKTRCQCGYITPFCSCGYFKPLDFKEDVHVLWKKTDDGKNKNS